MPSFSSLQKDNEPTAEANEACHKKAAKGVN